MKLPENIEARDYQLQIISETIEAIERGHKSILIVSPTGSGKTITGHLLLHELYNRYGYNAGWTSMRRFLWRQARRSNEKLTKFPHVRYFSLFDKDFPTDVDVRVEDECLPAPTIIETEDGLKTIREIVDSKYSGRVLSFNGTNNEWCEVTNWYKRDNDKTWINPTRNNPNKYTDTFKQLWCTPDHTLFYIDDPLNPIIKQIAAKDIAGKYLVAKPTNYKRNNINPYYNSDQLSVIIGSVLGDGSVGKSGRVRLQHCSMQSEYLDWKAKILGGNKSRHDKWSGYRWKHDGFRDNFAVTSQTSRIRDICYINNQKKITNDIVEMADIKTVAIWYMDDGSISRKRAVFHTEGFDKESVINCQKILAKFDINSKIAKSKTKYHIIQLNVENTKKMMGLISKYRCSSMNYKFTEHHDLYKWDSKKLDFGTIKINHINNKQGRAIKGRKLKYDIEVKKNHNFYANGYLVHNCHHSACNTSIWQRETIDPAIDIGLTATNYRTDKLKLAYSKVVNGPDIDFLVNNGFLSPYHFYALRQRWNADNIARLYLSDAARWGKSVIFLSKVDNCYKAMNILSDAGIKCDVVHANSDQENQIEAFINNDLQVLLNVFVLTEGFDVPDLKTGFVRSASEGPTIQMCGRVLRTHGSKKYAQIVQPYSAKHPFTNIAEASKKLVQKRGNWDEVSTNSLVEIASKAIFRRRW